MGGMGVEGRIKKIDENINSDDLACPTTRLMGKFYHLFI